MNFRFLFAAIRLFDKNPSSLKSILFDARRRLRYANPPPPIARKAELRGIKLLNGGNFRDLTSGWFEPGPILFPPSLHPKTEAETLERLRWMLDCRLDETAGEYLWAAVNDALPSRNPGTPGTLYRCKLEALASSLIQLSIEQPSLFDLLMAGRLGGAKVWLGKAIHPTREALRLIRMMSIVWMLFDLQIVSYRLFRAEFVALDQPLTEARFMTLSAIEKEFEILENNALACKAAFENGQSRDKLPKSLREFLKQSDLWRIALVQLRKLHSHQPSQEEILAEVQQMLARTARWSRRLHRLWNNRRSAFGLTFDRHSKSTYEIDLAPMPQARAADAGRSSTAIQFGAPSVTLLLFAVTEAVEDLSRQPAHLKADRLDRLEVGSRQSLFNKKTSQRLITQLFTVYRDLYARPANSQRPSVKKEAAAALNHAVKDGLIGRPDIGLERMPKAPLRYPLEPFCFGMSTGKLLSPGLEDEGLPPSPESFSAKRIDTATEGRVTALRNRLSTNPMALDRIQEIHVQFKAPRAKK